jgi:hypothetical protein
MATPREQQQHLTSCQKGNIGNGNTGTVCLLSAKCVGISAPAPGRRGSCHVRTARARFVESNPSEIDLP